MNNQDLINLVSNMKITIDNLVSHHGKLNNNLIYKNNTSNDEKLNMMQNEIIEIKTQVLNSSNVNASFCGDMSMINNNINDDINEELLIIKKNNLIYNKDIDTIKTQLDTLETIVLNNDNEKLKDHEIKALRQLLNDTKSKNYIENLIKENIKNMQFIVKEEIINEITNIDTNNSSKINIIFKEISNLETQIKEIENETNNNAIKINDKSIINEISCFKLEINNSMKENYVLLESFVEERYEKLKDKITEMKLNNEDINDQINKTILDVEESNEFEIKKIDEKLNDNISRIDTDINKIKTVCKSLAAKLKTDLKN